MRISDWSSDVCSSDLLQARDGRNRRAGTGGDQAAIEGDLRFIPRHRLDDQRVRVLETRFAMQQLNVGVGVENALVLGVTQFVDTTLLLGKQSVTPNHRRHTGDAIIERTDRKSVV